MEKYAIVADTHPPFQDSYAVDLACQVIADFKPDVLVHLGDGIDFYAVSHFDRDPDRVLKLQDELDSAKAVNRDLVSASPNAKKVYIEGNHEYRWARYLMRHPEIANLKVLAIQELLGLESWEYNEEQYSVLSNRLKFIHGRRISKHSGFSAKYALESAFHQQSVLMGHSHRQGVHFVTGPRWMVTAVEVGCLCQPMEYSGDTPNWQQGIALITADDSNRFGLELLTFLQSGRVRRVIWREREYTAK